ncbi:MAG TPA: cytochrome c [Myxococcales bacterium]|nr:cytochrome c [Myxococcales bacterium]
MKWAVVLLASLGARGEAAAPARAADAMALLEVLAVDDDAQTPGARAQVEQRERAAAAARILSDLDGILPEPHLDLARQLRVVLEAGGPQERSVSLARTLQRAVERRFGLLPEPPRPPDLRRGSALYAQSCAACHGAEGWPLRKLQLSTPPTALADRAATHLFSPRHVFLVASAGVPETAMPSFAESLDEEARWDLSFFVAALPQRGSRDGEALARARRAGFDPGYRQLAVVSDDFLRLQLQATGLSGAQLEGALTAVRGGPFSDAPRQLPPLVLPQSLVPLRLLRLETEDEAGTPVERAALALPAPLALEQWSDLLLATRNVALQLLGRGGRPPFDLNVTVYESAAAAREGRGAVASCNLVSDEEIECDARPVRPP